MSNVLDLDDQTFFGFERATGTSLLQWSGSTTARSTSTVCAGFITIFSRDGCPAASNARRCPSAAIAGSRSGQSDLEIVATPRPREEFDAWLAEQANRPLDIEHGSRMAPRGAALHRRRRRGELGRVTLPHRRRGLCEAVADAAAAATTGSTGLLRAHAGGGRHCAKTPAKPSETSPLSAEPSSPRHDWPGATAAARRDRPTPPPAMSAGADEPITLPTATIFVDADEWDARATRSEGPATRCSREWPPGSPSESDGSPQTARSPWVPVNERTADDTRANAVTNVDITVDPHPRRRTCAKSGPQRSKR